MAATKFINRWDFSKGDNLDKFDDACREMDLEKCKESDLRDALKIFQRQVCDPKFPASNEKTVEFAARGLWWIVKIVESSDLEDNFNEMYLDMSLTFLETGPSTTNLELLNQFRRLTPMHTSYLKPDVSHLDSFRRGLKTIRDAMASPKLGSMDYIHRKLDLTVSCIVHSVRKNGPMLEQLLDDLMQTLTVIAKGRNDRFHVRMISALENMFRDDDVKSQIKNKPKLFEMYCPLLTDLESAMQGPVIMGRFIADYTSDFLHLASGGNADHFKLWVPYIMMCITQPHTKFITAAKDVIKENRKVLKWKSPGAAAEVFLSYQWGMQPQVKALYKVLTSHGYRVWMDIHQMGGGDSLYDKIDKGIRGCRVIVSCVTENYTKSANCRREVSLADAIKKPIVPLLLETTDWPPSGPMGMVFSQLLYIDMATEVSKDGVVTN